MARIPRQFSVGTHPKAVVQYGLKGTDFEVKQGTENEDCIYYSPYPARISRPYTGRTAHKSRSVQSVWTVLFCTIFEVNNRHKFQGSFLYGSGTVFEEYDSI